MASYDRSWSNSTSTTTTSCGTFRPGQATFWKTFALSLRSPTLKKLSFLLRMHVLPDFLLDDSGLTTDVPRLLEELQRTQQVVCLNCLHSPERFATSALKRYLLLCPNFTVFNYSLIANRLRLETLLSHDCYDEEAHQRSVISHGYL